MSNRNQIEQEIITQRFVSYWVPQFPALAIRYENRNFTPPINQPWVGFTIRSGRVAEAAISAIMPRGVGIVYLQVFLPENAGTIEGRTYVDAFADVFDNWHYVYGATALYPKGDFWFKRVEVIPNPPHDGWLQWTASVEFKHDEQVVSPIASSTDGVPEAPMDGKLYGRQDAAWSTVPAGNVGDMTKAQYDPNADGVVTHAALADAAPWGGITGKPVTFPPDGTAEFLANKGVHGGYAGLDGAGKVPLAQLPPFGTGDMTRAVYDSNADNVVDHAALADVVAWSGITGRPVTFPSDWTTTANKPATFPPDATAELVARKGAVNGYASLDGTGKVPAAQLPAAAAVVSSMNVFIETPTAKTYVLDLDAPVAYQITKLAIQLGAGTCTAALLRNGTAISGATSVAVSTTLATVTLSQAVAVDDNISLQITAPSSAANLSVAVRTTQ